MVDYRRRLLAWMHAQEMAGHKVTLREISERSGVSWSVVQRLAAGKLKTPRADTLEKIGVGIGEGTDFFFRENWQVREAAAEYQPELCAIRDPGKAQEAYDLICREQGCTCHTFELTCECPKTGELETVAFRDGRVIYSGPDRRKRRGER